MRSAIASGRSTRLPHQEVSSGRENWLAEFCQQRLHNGVVGYPQTQGSPLWMKQSFWYLAGTFQDEGVGPRRCHFQQPESAVVDTGVFAELGQVGTDQRQMMLVVNTRNCRKRRSVGIAKMAAECIRAVG